MNTVFSELDYINTLHMAVCREMSEKRLSHVVSVAKTAFEICILLGLSEEETEKTVTGAYLHDITKEKDRAWHLEFCEQNGIVLTDDDKRADEVLHQITGAPYAKEVLPDAVCPTVYGAISSHCTGNADMSIYEKIVFLADYIEPTRKNEACKALNHFFFCECTDGNIRKHLDKAVLLAYDNTVRYLSEKGGFIHPATLLGREDIIKTLNPERKI